MHVLMDFQESDIVANFPYFRFLLPIFIAVCEVARICVKRRKEFSLALVHPQIYGLHLGCIVLCQSSGNLQCLYGVCSVNVVVCSVISLCLLLNVQKANSLPSGLRVRISLDQMGKSFSATVAVKR